MPVGNLLGRENKVRRSFRVEIICHDDAEALGGWWSWTSHDEVVARHRPSGGQFGHNGAEYGIGKTNKYHPRISLLSTTSRFPTGTALYLVLLSQQIPDGHLHVLEGDVGGSGAPDAAAVHSASLYTLRPRNQQHADALGAGSPGPHSAGEVVRPDAVGDPLFFAVHNVELAALGLLRAAPEVGHVRPGGRLRDGQADAGGEKMC